MTVDEGPELQEPSRNPQHTRGEPVTVRGDNQWPLAGTTNGRSRGQPMAAYGEFLMAAVNSGGDPFGTVTTILDATGRVRRDGSPGSPLREDR